MTKLSVQPIHTGWKVAALLNFQVGRQLLWCELMRLSLSVALWIGFFGLAYAQDVSQIAYKNVPISLPQPFEASRKISADNSKSIESVKLTSLTDERSLFLHARQRAVGDALSQRIPRSQAIAIGIVTLMNNNSNDGSPATFTGANGSNFCAGG